MTQAKPPSKPLQINHATAIAAARLFLVPVILKKLLGCSDDLLELCAFQSTELLARMEKEDPAIFRTTVREASEMLIRSLPNLEEEGMDLERAISRLKQ